MGILDDHNPYPALPHPAIGPAHTAPAAALSVVFAAVWLYGVGSLVGLAAASYALLNGPRSGWVRTTSLIGTVLSLAGLVVGVVVGLGNP